MTQTLNHSISARLLAFCMGLFAAAPMPALAASSEPLAGAAVEEILNQSLAQKKGLAIYISGQVINALFVKRIDANTIEVRNQSFGRMIIRMDRVDAIAIS
jgi:phage replication-related protein YjqB (UPF0714/DUF867 family)